MDENEAESWRQALASEFRAERHALGLTQDEVVEQTGMSKSAIVRIERGVRDATIAQITTLCNVYGIMPSALLARVEERRTRTSTPTPTELEPEEPAIATERRGRRSRG